MLICNSSIRIEGINLFKIFFEDIFMKTLIAYGTKSGTAKSLSEMLSKKIKAMLLLLI
jgi:hypothetical protein